MPLNLFKGKSNKEETAAAVEAKTPSAAKASPAPALKADDCDMFVSLKGKRLSVSVAEILPRFTVTLNGKTYAVDVAEA